MVIYNNIDFKNFVLNHSVIQLSLVQLVAPSFLFNPSQSKSNKIKFTSKSKRYLIS